MLHRCLCRHLIRYNATTLTHICVLSLYTRTGGIFVAVRAELHLAADHPYATAVGILLSELAVEFHAPGGGGDDQSVIRSVECALSNVEILSLAVSLFLPHCFPRLTKTRCTRTHDVRHTNNTRTVCPYSHLLLRSQVWYNIAKEADDLGGIQTLIAACFMAAAFVAMINLQMVIPSAMQHRVVLYRETAAYLCECGELTHMSVYVCAQ